MKKVSFSLALALLVITLTEPLYGQAQADLGAIKQFLVNRVTTMDNAAHDFVQRSVEYQAVIARNGGDYNKAAIHDSGTLLPLLLQMQADYRIYHNNGYETIEGVTAGVRQFVDFDNYLDAGVPKAEASTDSPASPLVLKTPDGKIIVDHDGNLFHYVIEPTLWGTKEVFVRRLSPEASTAARGLKALPRSEVLSAASTDLAKKLDELLAKSQAWNPTLDECVGALVWMTPTLNGYFDDWRDSRYNPTHALGHYVAQSRVLDMRGIMSSLQLAYHDIEPALAVKDPALAKQIETNYAAIMNFIARLDAQEKKGKMSLPEIEEMAYQAKSLTDQLSPELKQTVALLNVKLPRKPILI